MFGATYLHQPRKFYTAAGCDGWDIYKTCWWYLTDDRWHATFNAKFVFVYYLFLVSVLLSARDAEFHVCGVFGIKCSLFISFTFCCLTYLREYFLLYLTGLNLILLDLLDFTLSFGWRGWGGGCIRVKQQTEKHMYMHTWKKKAGGGSDVCVFFFPEIFREMKTLYF